MVKTFLSLLLSLVISSNTAAAPGIVKPSKEPPPLTAPAPIGTVSDFPQTEPSPPPTTKPSPNTEKTPDVSAKQWDDFALLNLNGTPNKMVSPVSIKQALGLLAHGLGEEKSKTFLNSLGYKNLSEYDKNVEALISKYKKTDKTNEDKPIVEFANAVWYVDNKYKPKEKYKTDTARIFGADITYVPRTNFADKVNAWTSDKTKGKIKEIVKDDIAKDPDFKALLENATYFKANWSRQFKSENTKEADFHNADGTTSKTPLMFQSNRFLYFKGNGYAAVQLNYDRDLSMIVLLPDAESSIPFKPNEKILDDTIKNLKSTEVNLYLPKFHTEYELSKELLNYLKPYKMFNVPAEEMFVRPADGRPLSATDIIHKTVIDLDENGTEAAAVTAIIMETSAVYDPRQPVEFRADRPFYYVIRDNSLNENLFVGVQSKF